MSMDARVRIPADRGNIFFAFLRFCLSLFLMHVTAGIIITFTISHPMST